MKIKEPEWFALHRNLVQLFADTIDPTPRIQISLGDETPEHYYKRNLAHYRRLSRTITRAKLSKFFDIPQTNLH